MPVFPVGGFWPMRCMVRILACGACWRSAVSRMCWQCVPITTCVFRPKQVCCRPIRKRSVSHAFRLAGRVTEAPDLKAMHKAELKVSDWRHDRDHHGTRASAALVDRREVADCRGDGG